MADSAVCVCVLVCVGLCVGFRSYVPVSHLVDGMHHPLDVVLGPTARLGAHGSRHSAAGVGRRSAYGDATGCGAPANRWPPCAAHTHARTAGAAAEWATVAVLLLLHSRSRVVVVTFVVVVVVGSEVQTAVSHHTHARSFWGGCCVRPLSDCAGIFGPDRWLKSTAIGWARFVRRVESLVARSDGGQQQTAAAAAATVV